MATLRIGSIVKYGLLVLVSLLFLTPVYVIIVTSIKPIDQVSLSQMWTLPTAIDFSSYKMAFESLKLGAMNGYILSKWKFRGSDMIFTFILFGMFIPYQSILIPVIQFLRTIELYNTIPGLVLVHVVYGLPITTLMFRNFYASIPDEMIESAQIDGANF
ncbi:carbohydrate ABC transporter permease, partial [Microvirga sp. 3-52]|nr:carbohydrate ABC transporter permease [Microvirga sp. 3-52]